MDLWNRARVIAEEAARRSQEISLEAARLSQGFVNETAKKSKEFATEASTLIRTEAVRRADQIKTLAGEIDIPPIPNPIEVLKRSDQPVNMKQEEDRAFAVELERFGITDELREFVRGITVSTFRDFPLQDGPDVTDVPSVSNVRQDLNEWQARHATLVLSAVKEMSKFRYELCPRYMKERKFWRIYFILVNNFVTQYEDNYFAEHKLKLSQQEHDFKLNETKTAPLASNTEASQTTDRKLQSRTSNASNQEHDLDVFLLGDLGSSDEDPDDGGNDFDDLDKIEDQMLSSEDDSKEVINA